MNVQLFLGIPKTSEVQMHQRQSKTWQEATLIGTQLLSESYFQDKEYLGQWLPSATIDYDQLIIWQENLQKQLQIYFPELNTEKLDFILFPQVLMG